MRFSLQTLLLAVAVVWTSLVVFELWGFAVALFLLAAVAYIRLSTSLRSAAARTGAVAAITSVAAALILPALEQTPGPSSRQFCMLNLKMLGDALRRYHAEHGRLPPAYLPDGKGKPVHSWRVLTLRYVDEDLYAMYDPGEPWNGPNNRKLTATRPKWTYVCRKDRAAWNATTTSYLAVVGPGTVWEEGKQLTFKDVRDPKSTILLVETAGSGIEWTEPRDLSLSQALAGVNPKSKPGISSRHTSDDHWAKLSGAGVLFADGSVGILAEDLPKEKLEMLLDRDHEPIDRIEFDELVQAQQERDRWNRIRIFAIAAMVLSVMVLLFRPRRTLDMPTT